MDSRYINALEQRLAWAKWADTDRAKQIHRERENPTPLRLYRTALWNGETFFMNARFCQLVDYARRTIPDELQFETEWVPTRSGWLMVEEPFEVPMLRDPSSGDLIPVQPRLSAVGWMTIGEEGAGRMLGSEGKARPGAIVFCCFQDMDLFARDAMKSLGADHPAVRYRGGFGMWSYFILQPGETVMERARSFERFAAKEDDYQAGRYAEDRTTDMLHEIRWVYTAMHLMSEKLAATVEHRADRHARKRLEREKFTIEPMVKLITLRRMEEHRPVEHTGPVEWQWQWHVQGHWRNQWYAKEQVNKLKWIEEYIKGPTDKPLKPVAPVLYKVER